MVRLAEACGTEGIILDSAGAKRLADAGRMLPDDAWSRIETVVVKPSWLDGLVSRCFVGFSSSCSSRPASPTQR